ncbi:MAG: HIT family protein [Eubacterium sp.]|nr:HIT family protein [Eubacterium sp.]
MRDENCIFCKIISGDIPSTVVYEDDDVKAILDVNPAATGHVIVLPKYHAANIFETPDDVIAKTFAAAKKIAAGIKKAFNCDGVNILQNNGEAAGQTVFHLHVHVIPRFDGDKDDIAIRWKQGDAPENGAEIAKKISDNM